MRINMLEKKKQMGRDRVSRLVNWGHWFAFFNGLLAMIVGSRYIETVGNPDTWYAWCYLVISTIGQFSFLAFMVYLVFLFPVTFLLPYSKILRGFAALIASLGLCILLYDTIVYDDYGLHLSPFAFDLAWADLSALLHGTSYIVTPLAIIAIELTAANFIWKRLDKLQRLKWGPNVLIVIGACFVTSHLVHIWADAADVTAITRFDDAYPLSYPATARSFMESHGLDRNSELAVSSDLDTGLKYPLQPLQCQTETQAGEPVQQSRTDILLIAIDSLRQDLVDERTMPFLHGYSRANQSFKQHFSGGNQFDSGMFSLLYGLQGSYINALAFNQTSPLLTQTLKNQGYRLGLFANESNIAGLRPQAMFKDFEVHAASETQGNAAADMDAIASFGRWQHGGQAPWMALVNLKSPENYDTPVGFLGIETVEAPRHLKPAQKVLFNQYRQSLNFIDKQLQALLQDLPKETLVVVTGVNGKLFTSNADESRTNLSPANVRVPLAIHWPQGVVGRVKYRTSHYGLVPTLMTQVLGCSNAATDYSAGRSLLQPDEESWIYIGDSRIFAIYQEDEITRIDRHGKYRIYDADYNQRLDKKLSAPELIQVMREGRRLYNH
jgi:uncharacterized protein